MEGLLERVPVDRVIVAIDPGKVLKRVWVTTGEGMVGEPLSLPTSRCGVDRLASVVAAGSDPVFALEATGALHRAWAGELERRWPGSLRLFAPSLTQAARTQLGTRRFKTDDRDCAALVWLARHGGGQPPSDSAVDALRAAVSHRRQLILALKPLRQRLHDQLKRACAWAVCSERPRPGTGVGNVHRPRGRGLRSPLRGTPAEQPIVGGARERANERRDREVLVDALAGLPCAALGRRPASREDGSRPRTL